MSFFQQPIAIAAFLVLGAGALALFLVSVRYATKQGKVRGLSNDQGWILKDFNKRMYQAIYGDTNPILQAKKNHIKVKEYLRNCKTADVEPKLETLCVFKIYGLIALIACIPLSLFIGYIAAPIGAGLYIAFWILPEYLVRKKAERKRDQIEQEIPRFLDLLSTELTVGLPIESAITTLSQRLDGLLAEEFQWALGDMQLGAASWSEALQKVAEKYNSLPLGKFVSHVTNAYAKGVSITETVTREAKEFKQTQLLSAKERAGKSQQVIVLPVMLLQLMPMMLFLLLPILSTMRDSTF